MAFENLFIRTQKSLGGIQLDAVLSESHSTPMRLTTNPIELGADITDHVIIEPIELVLVVEVSDTPLGVAAFGAIVDLITGLFGTSTTSNLTRSNAAYNALVQLKNAREPIQVQTRLRLYKDMLITNIPITQDKNSSRIASMTINLTEALITESQIVQLTPEQLQQGSPTEQGSSPEQRGRQEPVTPTDTIQKSVLKTAKDWIFGP